MKTTVIARLEVEATHHWPQAVYPVHWLASPHRHTFVVTVAWCVDHPDREREIFIARDRIREVLGELYPTPGMRGVFDFGPRSCEQVAVDLLGKLEDAAWCEVWEEETGGARVER